MCVGEERDPTFVIAVLITFEFQIHVIAEWFNRPQYFCATKLAN